jgi:hypothetical protein
MPLNSLVKSELDAAFVAWESFLGEPYRWGGDDPMAGVDCSGLALEGLKACGKFDREGDARALDLARKWPAVTALLPGCLVFYGSPIYHVEIVWAILASGQVLTLAASGGGSQTISLEEAIKHNAFVKIRPMRPGYVRAVDPFGR